MKNKIRCQVFNNKLESPEVSLELKFLNKMEVAVIPQHLLFKVIPIIAKDRIPKGAICNIATDVHGICSSLPRGPQFFGVILIKLKLGFSTFKKRDFICFNESPLKMIKNDFTSS